MSTCSFFYCWKSLSIWTFKISKTQSWTFSLYEWRSSIKARGLLGRGQSRDLNSSFLPIHVSMSLLFLHFDFSSLGMFHLTRFPQGLQPLEVYLLFSSPFTSTHFLLFWLRSLEWSNLNAWEAGRTLQIHEVWQMNGDVCPAPFWKEIRLGSGVVLKRFILGPKYLVGGFFFFHHKVGKAQATQTADMVESVSR